MIRLVLVVHAAFAVLIAGNFAGAQEPSFSDLDQLLTLLGQGGVVNNEHVLISNNRTGEGWLRELEKLAARPAPRARDSADALRRLKPVADDIQAALADEKKTRELNAEVRKKVRSGDIVTPVVLDSLFGLSDEQLNQMEAKGGAFEQQAQDYRRRRAEAQVGLGEAVRAATGGDIRPCDGFQSSHSSAASGRVQIKNSKFAIRQGEFHLRIVQLAIENNTQTFSIS